MKTVALHNRIGRVKPGSVMRGGHVRRAYIQAKLLMHCACTEQISPIGLRDTMHAAVNAKNATYRSKKALGDISCLMHVER